MFSLQLAQAMPTNQTVTNTPSAAAVDMLQHGLGNNNFIAAEKDDYQMNSISAKETIQNLGSKYIPPVSSLFKSTDH